MTIESFDRAVVFHRVRDKKDLLAHFKEAFQFPDHFGKNWDALQDSLIEVAAEKNTLIVLKRSTLSADDLEVLQDIIDEVCLILESPRYELAVFPD